MTIKTKGQKRKGRARLFAALAFLISTALAVSFFSYLKQKSESWILSHENTVGTVVDSYVEINESRNRKGRKRTTEEFYVDYEYKVDGNNYSDTQKISESSYNAISTGDEVTLWYNPEDPSVNMSQREAENAQSENPFVSMAIIVAPYTLGGSAFLFFLLNFFYVRESGNALAEGFYTESSWLDVEDRMLVSIVENEIAYFEFDDKHASKVQKAYQNKATFTELSELAKAKDVKTVALSSVTGVKSVHYKDTLKLYVVEDDHYLEFLNAGFKAHALERIIPYLPTELIRNQTESSRLTSAAPYIVALVVMGALALWSGVPALQAVLGVVALIKVVPGLVRRLMDPAVTITFEVPEEPVKATAGAAA